MSFWTKLAEAVVAEFNKGKEAAKAPAPEKTDGPDFDVDVEHIFVSEGGYVDHPEDPGGATNMGITFRTLQDWRGTRITKSDVKNLSKDEAKAIYKENYWDPLRASELPKGVALVVFDAGVNSGISRSSRWLQKVLGVEADGRIGPITLKAANEADPVKLVNDLCDHRIGWLRRLRTWKTFGKGWSRRVNRVRDDALKQLK